MPTYFATRDFWRMFLSMTPAQRERFMIAVSKLVEDLARGNLRKSLRVKRVQGMEGAWEMSWAPDGRAVFEYGPEVRIGHPHIVWLRVGGHEIFD